MIYKKANGFTAFTVRLYTHSGWPMFLGIATIHHESFALNHKYRAAGVESGEPLLSC